MTKQIFVIYDSKVKAYQDPITVDSVGRALRAFGDLVNDPRGNDVSSHPQDFSLHHIGSFDISSGKITTFSAPVSYGLAVEYKKGVNNG